MTHRVRVTLLPAGEPITPRTITEGVDLTDALRSLRFAPAGTHAARVQCTVCSAVGYPYDGPRTAYPQWWGWVHLGDHVPCPTCTRPYTPGAGLAAHRRLTHGEHGRGLGLAP